MDPQGAASYTLRGDPLERASPKKLLNGERHLPELILSSRLHIEDDFMPHWTGWDARTQRLVVTGYGDDHRLFMVKLDQATGTVSMDRRFTTQPASRRGARKPELPSRKRFSPDGGG